MNCLAESKICSQMAEKKVFSRTRRKTSNLEL